MKHIAKYGPFIAAALAFGLFIYVGNTIRNYRPPDEFTMATGPVGGAYYEYGIMYEELLAEEGYTLHLVPTGGSKENLRLLEEGKVDVALVQAGTATEEHAEHLSSLGSLFYEPLWIFYRLEPGEEPLTKISDLKGMHIAIGEEEGGTHDIAKSILEQNGITDNDAVLYPIPNLDATQKLIASEIDALFMIASPEAEIMQELFYAPGLELLSIDRILAYQSRNSEVSTITLGEGAINLALNIPDQDIETLTTVAAFVAPHDLSADLGRLLLDVAEEVHGPGGVLEKRGEFPSSKLVELPMDVGAEGYLEHGTTGLDRFFPLWMASRLERLLFLVVPFLVLLYPLLRTTPLAVTFFFRIRINRWYRRLRIIELNIDNMTLEELDERISWLDELEQDLARRLAVPMMYLADVYLLRFQVGQVNHRLERRRDMLISGEVQVGEPSDDEDDDESAAPFSIVDKPSVESDST